MTLCDAGPCEDFLGYSHMYVCIYNYKFHVQALRIYINPSLKKTHSKSWSEYIICSHKFLISSDRGERITKKDKVFNSVFMLRLYLVFVNLHGPLPPATCDLVSMTPPPHPNWLCDLSCDPQIMGRGLTNGKPNTTLLINCTVQLFCGKR